MLINVKLLDNGVWLYYICGCSNLDKKRKTDYDKTSFRALREVLTWFREPTAQKENPVNRITS